MACVGAPPSPPAGADGGSGSSGGPSAATTTPGSGSNATTDANDTSGGMTSGPGTDSDSSAGPGPETDDATTESGTPLLEISDGPLYDFGQVSVGDSLLYVFTVTNVGDGTATGLSGLPSPAHFPYEGGDFPGLEGSCGDSLGPGDACAVSVAFTPTDIGFLEGTLAITYDGGDDVELPLAGAGAGVSDNLLDNPGGELQGTPPPGWTNAGDGEWTSDELFDGVEPFEGVSFISADTGPNVLRYSLIQVVDVSMWTTTIDQGLMWFAFEGYARSQSNDNDDYRIRVLYRDETNASLETWTSGWNSDSEWTMEADQRTAPVGTRSVEVELQCRKFQGSFCDAYFDGLRLGAQYP